MPKRPRWAEAQEKVLDLTYAPTTLTIDTAKAVGHRLAKAVVAKGNLPSRPVALVDGLAVVKSDLVPAELATPAPAPAADDDDDADVPVNGELAEADESPADAPADPSDNGRPAGLLPVSEAELAERAAAPAPAPPEITAEPVDDRPPLDPTVHLTLRPFPATNRREDALDRGQAIPVPVGGEVPRGGELVYPLSALAPEILSDESEDETETPAENANGEQAEGNGEENGDEGAPPVTEPPRDWDLPAKYVSGEVELPRYAEEPDTNMIPIGGWARNRDELVPERTILRPPEMTMLLALGVEEVTIYRRPVVGVASLGLPFPTAGHSQDEVESPGICPLAALAANLMRAARVAALPLGFAPKRFHELVAAVERWVSQVDILLLVGGSHNGPRCRGLDVLNSAGKVMFSGINMQPGGTVSVGKVKNQPVIVTPGSLPDVLVSTVLLARPLSHKYLTPHHYEDQIELALDNGSRLSVNRDTVIPVRYSFDRMREKHYTRFSGLRHDPWLEFIRGQALVVLQEGRRYEDGEPVTAYRY
ncbi:hypothetical protein JW859_06050 [bacterium]|nr:hypothetical protein [bacterium]